MWDYYRCEFSNENLKSLVQTGYVEDLRSWCSSHLSHPQPLTDRNRSKTRRTIQCHVDRSKESLHKDPLFESRSNTINRMGPVFPFILAPFWFVNLARSKLLSTLTIHSVSHIRSSRLALLCQVSFFHRQEWPATWGGQKPTMRP